MSNQVLPSQLLKYAGAATATLRESDMIIPPAIIEASSLNGAEFVKLDRVMKGTLLISAAESGRKLHRHRVNLPQARQEGLGWTAGDVLEFEVVEDGVKVSKLKDRRSHESFVKPSLHSDGLPIPPAWMIQAFTGIPNLGSFLASGRRSQRQIMETANKWGLRGEDINSVLDFGSGCGRVLRHWLGNPDIQVTGCDLHDAAIDWCNTHYKDASFYVSSELPPSPNPSDSFDLIYAISVLTHLDEEHQDKWLAEWSRLVAPGGLVIATFRGEDFVDSVIGDTDRRNAIQADLNATGISFEERPGWSGVFESFYGGTYHSREYVQKHWGQHFEILELIDSGDFVNRQNAAIMRPRG